MSALTESAKVSAFVRRDLRIMLSYRMAAVGELTGVAGQAIAFSFVARLIDPSRLPSYGGTHAGYLEFVVIGIAMNMVLILMLHQLSMAIRNEQLAGTLESLLVTPTRLATIQTGSAAFQLLFVPLRMGFFVGVLAVVFGLNYHLSGLLPSVVILLGFLPFLWGLGLLGAGAILTFKRGNGVLMTGGTRARAGVGRTGSPCAVPSLGAYDQQGEPACHCDQWDARGADRRHRVDIGRRRHARAFTPRSRRVGGRCDRVSAGAQAGASARDARVVLKVRSLGAGRPRSRRG